MFIKVLLQIPIPFKQSYTFKKVNITNQYLTIQMVDKAT